MSKSGPDKPDEPIVCENCGTPIVDDVDERGVRVDEEQIPFSRTTDFVACTWCGELVPVRELQERRAGLRGATDAGQSIGALRDLTYEGVADDSRGPGPDASGLSKDGE